MIKYFENNRRVEIKSVRVNALYLYMMKKAVKIILYSIVSLFIRMICIFYGGKYML